VDTILVVDDQPEILELVRLMLESDGHMVLTARDGREAMRLMAQQAVDLVITDVLMPGQDGIETILQLRRDHPGVAVIAMSGGIESTAGVPESVRTIDFLKITKELGVAAVLRKPFKKWELLDQVNGVLRRRSGVRPP
jgi:CheY-like chemotaxis protein